MAVLVHQRLSNFAYGIEVFGGCARPDRRQLVDEQRAPHVLARELRDVGTSGMSAEQPIEAAGAQLVRGIPPFEEVCVGAAFETEPVDLAQQAIEELDGAIEELRAILLELHEAQEEVEA